MSTSAPLSVRAAASCAAATLVVYVGVAHEVVGATLYPDGPARFGGLLGWHAVGLAGIAAGLWLAAGVLRVFPVPVAPLAAVIGVMGGVVFVGEAFVHGGFHFFAFTLLVACGFLVMTDRRGVGGT